MDDHQKEIVLSWLDRAQKLPEGMSHTAPIKGKYIGGTYDPSGGVTRLYIGTEDILEAAKTNPIAYDEAVSMVADFDPLYLKDFAAQVHQGNWPRPKTTGGRGHGKWCNHRRDYAACIAITVFKCLGIKPSRNEEPKGTKGVPVSGCDLVASRLGLTHKAVKTIWGRRFDILKGSPGVGLLVEHILLNHLDIPRPLACLDPTLNPSESDCKNCSARNKRN